MIVVNSTENAITMSKRTMCQEERLGYNSGQKALAQVYHMAATKLIAFFFFFFSSTPVLASTEVGANSSDIVC